MSQSLTLARPYARAVYALAREHGQLPQWSSQLDFAARAVAEPAVQSLLAVAGAEKLIRREIDSRAHKALLDELAAEI